MVPVFTYSYHSNEDNLYTVQVLDRIAESGPDIQTSGTPFKLTYDVSDNYNPTAPIQYSKCSVGIEIINSTAEDELDAIIQGGEDQYFIIIQKEEAIIWRGILQVGLINKPRESYPFIVTLQASDGLRRLSGITVDMPSDAAVNNVLYFKEVLNRTGLHYAFEDDEIYLTTCCRLYENTMQGAFATGTDPLRYSRVLAPDKLAIANNTNGEISYRPQEKLLKDLLIAFGLQIRFANGHYHIIQIDAYKESILRLHHYTKLIDFNAANPSTVTAGAATLENFLPAKSIAERGVILVNDSYTYAPPLREVKIEREDFIGQVVQPFSVFDDMDTEISLGSVVSGNNTGLQFQFDVTVNWTNASAPSNFLVEFQVFIKVGTNVYTNKNGTQQWVAASSGDFYKTVNNGIAAPVGSTWFTNMPLNAAGFGTHVVDTPPLPAGGALSVQIAVKFTTLAGTDITSAFTVDDIEGSLQAVYKNFTGFQDNAVSLFFGRNESSSYVLDLGAVSIGDDPGTNSSGKLQVYDGTDWDDASSWRRFVDTNPTNRLLLTVIETIYRSQQKALSILNAGLIRNDITSIHTITVDGYQLLLQRGDFDSGLEQWDPGTTWIELQEYNNSEGPTGGRVNLPPKDFSPTGLGSEKYGKNDNTLNNLLPVGRTTEALSGTIDSLQVTDPGVNVGATGAALDLVNPITGDTERLTLGANWESGSTEISISEITLQNSYPEGSYITISIKNLVSRLSTLENFSE